MKRLLILCTFLLLAASSLFAQNATYEISFTVGAVRHQGLLMVGKTTSEWQLRVKYFDSGLKSQRLIEQKMRAEKTNLGTLLRGYSVWDVAKKQQAADYAADNFYLSYDKNGNVYSKNVDARGTAVSVQIAPVPADQKQVKLKEFGWL